MSEDYEVLAKAAYGHGLQGKAVQGYEIIPELTTDDRVAYRNINSNHVVISFRGTDPGGFKMIGPFYKSRAFRDVTTDIMMGLELENYNSRFQKAERTTELGIQKYGKENVTVVGHSLGGSQALHVSEKYGVEAYAYNPFVGPQHIRKRYPKATVVHNLTDPVSFASPFLHAKKVNIRYDKKRLPTISQHGINPKVKPKPKPFVPGPQTKSRTGPSAIQ
jgi:hypothetical protein